MYWGNRYKETMDNIKHIVKQVHNDIAPMYGLLKTDGAGDSWEHFLFQFTVEKKIDLFIPQKHFHTVTEIGCGNGQIMVPYLQKLDTKLFIGIDFSPNMLKHTQKRLKAYNLHNNVQLILGTGENIPLKDESVDYCYLYGVFEHLDDPQSVVKEMFRIVRPNGYLCIAVPIKYSIAFWTYLLLGISLPKWGKAITLDLNFRDKLKYYKFYSTKKTKEIFKAALNNASNHIIAEVPVCYFYGVGFFERILRKMFYKKGATFISKLDKTIKMLGIPPAGIYFIIKKNKN